MSARLLLLLLVAGLGCTGVSVHAWGSVAPPIPSESECRPYIEKALKELSPETTQEAVDTAPSPDTLQTTDASTEGSEQEGSIEGTEESVTNDSEEKEAGEQLKEEDKESNESKETIEQEDSKETDEIVDTKDSEEESGEAKKQSGSEEQNEKSGEQSEETEDSGEKEHTESKESVENVGDNSGESQEVVEGDKSGESQDVTDGDKSGESQDVTDGDKSGESQDAAEGESRDDSIEKEESGETKEGSDEDISVEGPKSGEDTDEEKDEESEEKVDQKSNEEDTKSVENSEEENDTGEGQSGDVSQENETKGSAETEESTDEAENLTEENQDEGSEEKETKEESGSEEKSHEQSNEAEAVSAEESGETEDKPKDQSEEDTVKTDKETSESAESQEKDDVKENESEEGDSKPAESVEDEEKNEKSDESTEDDSKKEPEGSGEDSSEAKSAEDTVSNAEESEEQSTPEEDLTIDVVIPEKLRPRDHIGQILKLDSESAETELLLSKTIDITLRDLKRLYDNAIQPLEILYKYRDLSNRHFGDPEIFSKPLILFMGPWSGGKSTIINYLLNNEYTNSALRTGAEPSPAYFNILMWGEQEQVLDGTQLAADWTFSGLQKFGQGLLDRLRGLKLKNPLLEKVNIVEIPGILEIRKQVERLFPFNDACQWFIDRADIIFLVYDPSKLDVGPETEAILDQLKGREYQTRIILNKADQVKPEELMRVQGTLIWNISPLMSSSEPPVMYSTSLWSIPYEVGSPSRLLYAQEKAFLRDLRDAIDKRVDNKIASARRFAVRVRNHAKMVDCYLTTYYNHKSFFGNRKKVADDIIEHPQNYHIYEGLSTLTNISRYDLPDPEVYRDFFRLNPVYDFQKLSSTCTYFRGCPINRLDVAIAYDLPELVGKYKRSAESVLASAEVPPKS